MRLDKVSIDGFKNLRGLELDFDERQLTTVLIGQNGAGKSNLIEAITQVFRWVDLRRNEPRFRYRVTYRIQPPGPAILNPPSVCLSNFPGEPAIRVNGQEVKRTEFEKRKAEWFPDLVFGYYSGGSRRLEALFDSHQRRYYDDIKREDDEAKVAKALEARRLFYCRPIHGVLALMALFAFPDEKVTAELASRLGITGFHSLLALFRRPSWYTGPRDLGAEDLWGAKGPAGRAARRFKELAFHPFALQGNAIDDYRDKTQAEPQFAAFIPSLGRMQELAKQFKDEREMFYALEAMDISDLVREIQVWVTRSNDASGDVGFADLSDGERQLLMVLGLIRVSRGKRALFLLDEPDTHLNPHWQHSYLKLIEDWTGIAAEKDHCHIVLTSHNPLTISALSRDEVRVISTDEKSDAIVAEPPFIDPRGLGIGGVLTDIFGMPSTLDQPTQDLIAARNRLARLDAPTAEQLDALDAVNEKLRALGFMYEERDELYRKFLRRLDAAEFTATDPRSPAELQRRELMMSHVIEELLRGKA
jgi:ABC-type cobalamin/Fe3+-siderophores transport system ATPase subunit